MTPPRVAPTPPRAPEYRCRWCDGPLTARDQECEICLEEELRRRIGQRSRPDAVRPMLDEMLTMVDLRDLEREIEAYSEAVHSRHRIGAARRALESRLATGPAGGVPKTLGENEVCARDQALRAILAYPYDYEESLRHAARAVALCFAWIVVRRVVPEAGGEEGPSTELELLAWVERHARESAWRVAYQETTAATEERLYSRFLAQLRARIDPSLDPSAA